MFDRRHWAACSIFFFLRETELEWIWTGVGGAGRNKERGNVGIRHMRKE